jgi:hypothetical protein
MIVAIGDVSGSQRRVRRQLGMRRAISPDALSPIPTQQGRASGRQGAQRSGVTASVIGYGLAGPLLLQPPAQLIDGAGMVPARS